MGNKTDYAIEWTQSLIIGTSLAVGSVVLFVLIGGFDLNTERGRLAIFIWAFFIGMIATYLALFKWKQNLTDVLVHGF